MFNGYLRWAISAVFLACACAACGSSDARELRETRVHLPTYGGQSWSRGTILPRERHVLERRPTGDGMFLINGRWFRAEAGHCWHWAAGDRIKLRAGDWHGGPVVIRNMRRARTCGFAG